MRVFTLGRPRPQRVSEDNPMFKGDVSMETLLDQPESQLFRAFEVTFRCGGRTAWHRHSCDQLLYITAGHGVLETTDEQFEVRTGDLVFIPANERHRHRSFDATELTHLALLTPGQNDIEQA